MRQANPAVVAFILVAAVLSAVSVARGQVERKGDVEIYAAAPDWKGKAGDVVLAPLSCSPAYLNCIKVEKKFLKKVQNILPVDGPDKLRSAFSDREVEAPTDAEVMTIARELGYRSVIFASCSMEKKWESDFDKLVLTTFGRTRLYLKTIDDVALVDGRAWRTPGTGEPFVGPPEYFLRSLLVGILKQAERKEVQVESTLVEPIELDCRMGEDGKRLKSGQLTVDQERLLWESKEHRIEIPLAEIHDIEAGTTIRQLSIHYGPEDSVKTLILYPNRKQYPRVFWSIVDARESAVKTTQSSAAE